MEKFVTMEWNEEELNRRKRIVTSFAEVVTTPRAASASAPRKEGRKERKGEFLSGQSVNGGIVIRDSGIGLQCKAFVRIRALSCAMGERETRERACA